MNSRIRLISKRRLGVALTREEKKKEEHFLQTAFGCFIVSAVLLYIWPGLLPFGLFDLWKTKGTWQEWLYTSWPVFAWGGGMTALVSMLTSNPPEENEEAEENLAKGFVISVMAGVFEEIAFRWTIFCSSCIGVQIVNFILFGFMGWGWVECLQEYLLGPVANFFTLGLLGTYLLSASTWYVGAGMLVANAKFRDGHKYLGFVGYLNSWFIGMFFFYLMFRYGLPAAILVHFLYDALIFFVRYVDQCVERARAQR